MKIPNEWKRRYKQFMHVMGFCRGNLIFINCDGKLFLECMKCLYRSKELLVKEIKQ